MERSIRKIIPAKELNIIPSLPGRRAFPPSGVNTDPFLMLDHVGPKSVPKDYFMDGTGHDHPHRGFETVSFNFEGHISHRDSLGNEAELKSGGVMRMNAGSGIVHGGDFQADEGKTQIHEVQLWVNLPAKQKMSSPQIELANAENIPQLLLNGMTLRVIGGEIQGLVGPISTVTPTKLAHLRGSTTSKLVLDDFDKTLNVFVYLLQGSFLVNGTKVTQGETLALNQDGDSINIEGSGEVLIIAGEPIEEEVVVRGPFAMTTEEEIDQAYADYKLGLFGEIKK